jgi:alanyl-tRNA synthetase
MNKMTKKLFYSDPKIHEWSTEITSIVEQDHKIMVTLAETAFYPTGGGQPNDIGLIDGIEVIDVFEEKDEIFHIILSKPTNKTVQCTIDEKRRIDHTQHHTAQHLLSSVCIELFNAHTVSFHLGEGTVTIDLDISELHEDQMKAIETKANQYIYHNREVKTYIVTKDELTKIPLRKIPDVIGEIRIVEIEGLDYSACCGTHVLKTAEIGILKLIKTEKHRGKTRLHFICGFRALNDYQEKHDILTNLTKNLSTSKEELIDRVKRIESEKKDFQRKLDDVMNENAEYLAESLFNTHQEPVIIETFKDKTIHELQILTRKMVSNTNQIVVFVSLLDKKCLIHHNGKSDFHCGQFVKENIAHFNGKGGGDQSKAQIIFTNESDIVQFLVFIDTTFNKKSPQI